MKGKHLNYFLKHGQEDVDKVQMNWPAFQWTSSRCPIPNDAGLFSAGATQERSHGVDDEEEDGSNDGNEGLADVRGK